MNTTTRLNTSFFIGTDDIFFRAKGLAIPNTVIQVQNTPCLVLKIGVTGKNPAPILPGLNSIFVEPTPYCGTADRCGNPALRSQPRYFACGKPRQGFVEFRWQLTGQRLNLYCDLRGKKQGVFPAGDYPQDRQVVVQRIAFATYSRSAWASRASGQWSHCSCLAPHRARSWHELPDNMVTYICVHLFLKYASHLASAVLYMGFFLAYVLLIRRHHTSRTYHIAGFKSIIIRHRIY